MDVKRPPSEVVVAKQSAEREGMLDKYPQRLGMMHAK